MAANTFLCWLSAFLVGCRRCWIVLVPLFVFDALGDSVLAKKGKKGFEQLPEAGWQSSRAHGVAQYSSWDGVMVVGEVSNTFSRAAVWERVQNEWMLYVLPSLDNENSWVKGAPPSPWTPNPEIRVVVGAAEDASMVARPTLWQRAEPGRPWGKIVLPGINFGRGEANAVGFPPEPMVPPFPMQPTVVGWSANDAGTPKAVVWLLNGGGGYEAHQLPDLMDSAMTRANAFIYDAMDHMVVVGSAVKNGSQKAVVWREDGGFALFDPPTELTLCQGCTEGEVRAISRSLTSMTECLAGWGGEDGGNCHRQALLWLTDDEGMTYTRIDLGVPDGFECSAASAVDCSSNGEGTVYGYVKDANGMEHAWSWSIDPAGTVEELSASVVNLPSNVMLEVPSAVDRFGNIAGWFMFDGSARGEVNGTHAFVLTPIEEAIPAVSAWGLIVMALLLLAGAKVYYTCRRTVRPPGA